MNPTSFVRLANDFHVVVDPDSYRMLCSRQGAGFRVAVIGLVSRGKSTLVNRIVGIDLCPVDPRAETVANIYISSGKAAARAIDSDGNKVPIGSDPAEFVSRLPRRITPSVKEAHFSGPNRLPDGLALVDTPGLNDAAIASKNLGELDRYWLDTGARAAVLVLSFPPGFGQSDRALLESAQRVFGSALSVVVKGTDSGIEREDLEQVAEVIASHTGMTPLVLGNEVPTGKWGTGDLAELEQRLTSLATQATTLVAGDAEELADLHGLAAFALATAPTDALPKLEQFATRYPGVPKQLVKAAEKRCQELTEQREHEQRALEKAAHLRRVQLLDRDAERLAALLAGQPGSAERSRSRGNVMNELLQLAREGSLIAQHALIKHLPASADVRREIGVGLNKFIAEAAAEQLAPLVHPLILSHSEAVTLVARSVPPTEREAITRIITSYAQRPAHWGGWRIAISELCSKAQSAELAATLRKIYRTKVIDELRYSINECRDANNCRSLIALVENAGKVLQRNALGAPDTNDDRIRFADALAIMRRGAYDRTAWVLDQLLNEEIRGASQMTRTHAQAIARDTYPVAKWLADVDHTAGARFTRLFAPNGEFERWAGRCEFEQADAARRSARRDDLWKGVWGLSFLVWFTAIATLPTDPGAAFGIWVVSLAMWFPAQSLKDEGTPWQLLFRTPAFGVDAEVT